MKWHSLLHGKQPMHSFHIGKKHFSKVGCCLYGVKSKVKKKDIWRYVRVKSQLPPQSLRDKWYSP